MSELLPDFLRGLVSAFMNMFLMLALVQPKYGKRITHFVMFGVMAVNFLLSLYCYLCGNLTMLSKLNIIFFVVQCVALKPFFKDTIMQWLFSYTTVLNVGAISVVLSFSISRHLPMPEYANVAVRFVFLSAVLYLFWIVIRPMYRNVVEHWDVFFFVAILIWINFNYYILNSDDIVKMLTEQMPQLLLLIALSIAMYFTIFHSLEMLSKEYHLREENLKIQNRQELLNVSITAMELRLRLQEEVTQQASIARHDHRHFSGVLFELLQQEQIPEALHMLEQQLTTRIKNPHRFCENTVVNAAISYYRNRCEQSGIMIEMTLDIPNETGIDSIELSMAISNLLENALNACEELPEGVIRNIQFRTVFTGQLLLEMKNPYIGKVSLDENGYPLPKEKGHGIGTKSMIAFVEKQNGQLTYHLDKGIFQVRMIL